MTKYAPGRHAAQVCFRAVSEFILEVVEGPDAGKRVVVDKPIVVGRDPEAGFVLEDREVSRRHLQLTPTGDHIIVEDLGSANGTFVNHNELHGPARLDAGDELLAGVTVMQVRDRQQVEARHSAVIAVPQALAMAPRTPTYADPQKVTADVHGEQGHPRARKVPRCARPSPCRERAVGPGRARRARGRGVLRDPDDQLRDRRSGPVAGWIYVNANTPTPNKNAVVGDPVHTTAGFRWSQQAKSYPTGGSGTPLVLPLPNSAGRRPVITRCCSAPTTRCCSRSIRGRTRSPCSTPTSHTGALTPVAGSPFSSFGMAPIALGYSNGTLVVANHGIIAPFNPLGPSPPGPSNLVSFKVSPTGALTKVSRQRRLIPTARSTRPYPRTGARSSAPASTRRSFRASHSRRSGRS